MREEIITNIIERSEELGEKANTLRSYLSSFEDDHGAAFNIEVNIPGKDSSVSDLLVRIHAIVDVVKGFDKTTKGNIISFNKINGMKKSIDASIESIVQLIDYTRTNIQNRNGISEYNFDNFHVKCKNGEEINLTPKFADFF